jgi:apolipoprotein N-acyltransferase
VAAITGKSAIVRADGSIDAATALFEEATIIDSVTLRQQGRTLYALVGDWLQWVAILALIVVATRDRVIAWWQRAPDADDAVTPYRLGE